VTRFIVVSTLLPCLLVAAPAFAREPVRCLTPQILDEFRASGATRDRPEKEEYADSPLYPIRVHYDLEDEEFLDTILTAADDAWRQQSAEWGWEAPGPDGGLGGNDSLDIYIDEADGAAGYTSPEDWFLEDGQAHCITHVVIDREIAETAMGPTTAHEVNHVLQLWADCAEDSQFLEASAVFAEDHYDPLGSGAWSWVAHFQEGWYRSLDYFEYSEPPQYGSFIFLQYVAERHGDGTPLSTREIWSDSFQGDWNNSNTWMDALERWLSDNWNDEAGTPQGGELYTELAWHEFSEWRFFIGDNDDGEHFDHGYHAATGIGVEIPYMTTVAWSALTDGPLEREIRVPMAETSTAAVPIQDPVPGATLTVELVAESTEDRWALSLMSVHAGKQLLEIQRSGIELGAGTVSMVVPEDTYQVILIAANVGDGLLDPNEDDWDRLGGMLTFTVEGGAPADDDAADDDDSAAEDKGGCGCRVEGGAPNGMYLLVVLAAVLAIRTRKGDARKGDVRN
jgi:MYXO-CTERM domain-containing protein